MAQEEKRRKLADTKQFMGIDYEAVLKNKKIRATLGPEKIAEAMEDGDFLPNLISEESNTVLTLGWDGDFPGLSGANYATEWNGLYFFGSSDHDREGPFDSEQEVLDLDYFHSQGTPNPELSSDVLPLERLLEIGRDIVCDDGDQIDINTRLFVLSRGKLVEAQNDATERDTG